MTPLVTIGIPFYNPGIFFNRAVRSIFAQTIEDWELILIDDGSTDTSLEIAKKVRADKVRVFSDGKKIGLAARLNQISVLARGTYLARMDADDLSHPLRLEKQLELLKKHTQGPVSTDAWIIDDEDEIRGKSIQGNGPFHVPSLLATYKWGGAIHASIMAPRSWFLQNPYSLNFPRAEDRELFVRIIGKSWIRNTPECLYFIRNQDVINVRSWLQGYASERKVLCRYGPQHLGLSASTYLLLRSMVKSEILRLASFAGFQRMFTKRKIIPTSQIEKNIPEQAVQLILKTPVPGWDD